MKKREFKNIGKLVKAAREVKGLSQTQLSKELGYKNGQFVSNIERGIIREDRNFINTTYGEPARCQNRNP
jgi:ribosome-binding protein aMBF1 (putative translation factor)